MKKKKQKWLVFRDEKAARYWHAEVVRSTLIVHSGKFGTSNWGRSTEYTSSKEACENLEKRKSRMAKKGYLEIDQESVSDWIHGREFESVEDDVVQENFIHSKISPATKVLLKEFASEVRVRLESAQLRIEKFPVEQQGEARCLETIDYLLNSITPAYIPVFSHQVSDKRNAFGQIGGGIFVNADYPTPEDEHGEPFSPLVQLNLTKISQETTMKVGEGFLQVWMDPCTWGRGVETFCRVVPPDDILQAEPWPESPKKPRIPFWEIELPDRNWNIVRDECTDDPVYEDMLFEIEYWGGASGFDWSLSSLVESSSGHPPVYIIDWQQIGPNIPSYGLIEVLLSQKFSGEGGKIFTSTLSDILSSFPEELKYLTFTLGFGLGLWPYSSRLIEWNNNDVANSKVNALPLFLFDGPLSNTGTVEDEHQIVFCRLANGEMIFKSKCCRWSF